MADIKNIAGKKPAPKLELSWELGLKVVIVNGLMAFIFLLISLLGHKEKSESQNLVVDLLQINDVYEITPLDSGRIGGMARVATLKKELLAANPNTLLLLAGDFLSPSVFNGVKQDSINITGKQMVAAMNAAGVDLVTFGNHEFDISYSMLQQRIDESSFGWISSNAFHITPSGGREPFAKNKDAIPPYWKKTFRNANGLSATIGFIGLTIPDNKGKPVYVDYDPAFAAAKRVYNEIAGSCDAVVAITHQDMAQDEELARQLPGLTAIIGGHEHDMRFWREGKVYITKAYANAKTAFDIRIVFNKKNKTVIVLPEPVDIKSPLALDTATEALCDRWMEVAKDYFRKNGFNPDSLICPGFNYRLDGTDVKVRSVQTNLTRLITDAMLSIPSKPRFAFLNAGSIRVDDIIGPPITEYSFLRALPYGDTLREANIKGFFIKRMLNEGTKLINDGAFLQYSDNQPNTPIQDSTVYLVSIANYLITGRQSKLEFIREDAPGVKVFDKPDSGDIRCDIRKVVIRYIQEHCRPDGGLERYAK